MDVYSRARLESKKPQVLEAVARHGSTVAAARAARVSRDAIHDWRHKDPAFASAFLLAKAAFKTRPELLSIDDALVFFTDAIRPYVPECLWPRIHSRMQIAVSERKFKAHGNAGRAVPSRSITQVGAPLQSQANGEGLTRSAGNGALHRRF